jgi:hypothetical protein
MTADQTRFRSTGIIVGVLFIVATAFLFVGEAFYRPYLDSPDMLQMAAAHRGSVVAGLSFEFMCILAMPMIGAFIFPVLARVSVGMALAYFFFRAMEAGILICVALINKFTLLTLSEAMASGGDPVAISAGVEVIRAQNAWANTDGSVYNILFALGALCLYATLYRSRMVPRWISVWGIAAILILLALVAGDVFVGPLPDWAALLLFPIAVQEMVMALWFIVRGFAVPDASEYGRDRQPMGISG